MTTVSDPDGTAPAFGSDRPAVVEVKNLVKTYGTKGFQSTVLKGVDLTICKHDFIAIMGPSGSGKTTLLNILSTIDRPSMGTVALDGQDLTKASNKELSRLRRDKIGFVFQDYSLLDTMTLQDNIALPLSLSGSPGRLCLQIPLPALRRPEAARRCLPRPDRRPGDHLRRRTYRSLRLPVQPRSASLPQSGK